MHFNNFTIKSQEEVQQEVNITPVSYTHLMSTQEGARFLEKPQGGRGILLGGVPVVKPAKVLVLGGGIVGTLSLIHI